MVNFYFIIIDVVFARAGVNEDKVGLSFDDNELTEWTNDGKISSGWVVYNLNRKALISEICLKLTGWRSRSYPLEIFVDDIEVWKGNTSQSLGYITIAVKPVKGKSVTIRLAGVNTENDAFENMIELSGKKELDLYKDTEAGKSSGQLRIVEAEFYETDLLAK